MKTGMGGDAFLLFYAVETGYVRCANGAGRAPRILLKNCGAGGFWRWLEASGEAGTTE
jgi:gamma-glutamyltranspeptidase